MSDPGHNTRGFALLEVVISLLLFALATLGLAGLQLSATRAGFEALQRSQAAAYAMDIMERMRANPAALAAYALAADDSMTEQAPENDCRSSSCTARELATYDLWYWRQTLLGGSERDGDRPVGGLVNARSCILVAGNTVEIVLAWRSPQSTSKPVAAGRCGINGNDRTQVLTLRGYIGEGRYETR